MAFSPQFLDELRARAGVVQVVGKRVKLTKKGREHMGLCPFHKEKTPSFTVNEEKGFFHCFGCQEHGSAIDFVMKVDGLSFPEAVERLAGEAGLQVPMDTPEERERSEQRQTLIDVTEKSALSFERNLRMPEGRHALSYLKERGLDDEIIAKFRLGFAPDTRGALKGTLAKDGISENLMINAGMIIQPDDPNREPYDRFRGRVMFPITDRRGGVIAFGGRIMGDGEPKYLNSPETALFHKGRVLYGLIHALSTARKTGQLIVTEGYMDVIALAQAGIETAVAPLGTALTEEQIGELWRVAPEPILCFDGDKAGRNAASRAAERALPLLKPGFGLRFVTLPEGEDPDSLVKRNGREKFEELLAEAQPLSDVLWRKEVGGRSLRTPEETAMLQRRIDDLTKQINDPTVRRQFQEAFKDRVWEARSKRRGNRFPNTAPPVNAKVGRTTKVDSTAHQERILVGLLIERPELYDHVAERLGSTAFLAPDLDKLRQEVLKTLDAEPDLDSEQLKYHLVEYGYSETLSGLMATDVSKKVLLAVGTELLEAVKENWDQAQARYKLKELQAEIHNLEQEQKLNISQKGMNRLLALKMEERNLQGATVDL
jgi:DNA primase